MTEDEGVSPSDDEHEMVVVVMMVLVITHVASECAHKGAPHLPEPLRGEWSVSALHCRRPARARTPVRSSGVGALSRLRRSLALPSASCARARRGGGGGGGGDARAHHDERPEGSLRAVAGDGHPVLLGRAHHVVDEAVPAASLRARARNMGCQCEASAWASGRGGARTSSGPSSTVLPAADADVSSKRLTSAVGRRGGRRRRLWRRARGDVHGLGLGLGLGGGLWLGGGLGLGLGRGRGRGRCVAQPCERVCVVRV